jgi:hypothetical protein
MVPPLHAGAAVPQWPPVQVDHDHLAVVVVVVVEQV